MNMAYSHSALAFHRNVMGKGFVVLRENGKMVY